MIDYKKLNDRIVQQAFMSMNETQVNQMLADKLTRAKALIESQEEFARRAKYLKHGKVD